MKPVLPFRLKQKWFALCLENVLSIGACGKIALTPSAEKPFCGLMQKQGKIIPVWSLFSIIQTGIEDVKNCQSYIELSINDKIIAVPVDEILPVTNSEDSWEISSKYGLTIYIPLDFQKPHIQQKVFEEKKNPQEFTEDTNLESYQIEEIGS